MILDSKVAEQYTLDAGTLYTGPMQAERFSSGPVQCCVRGRYMSNEGYWKRAGLGRHSRHVRLSLPYKST